MDGLIRHTSSMHPRWFRGLARLMHCLARPIEAARTLPTLVGRDVLFRKRLPWMSWGAIRYLRDHLHPGDRVLEWGAGGSTLFFASLGCEVTSIESSPEWAKRLGDWLRGPAADLAELVQLRLFPIHGSFRFMDQSGWDARIHAREVPANDTSWKAYLNAARDGSPWDCIIVDGLVESRLTCIKEALKHVAPDGIIVMDDACWPKFASVPGLLSAFKRKPFYGLGPCQAGVGLTDIYVDKAAPGVDRQGVLQMKQVKR